MLYAVKIILEFPKIIQVWVFYDGILWQYSMMIFTDYLVTKLRCFLQDAWGHAIDLIIMSSFSEMLVLAPLVFMS